MRLGTKTNNDFLLKLNGKNQIIQDLFLEKITKLTKTMSQKAMLGNSTVIEQTTFDPNNVSNFYDQIKSGLSDWDDHGITTTNNEDLRRIFIKLENKSGNYQLSMHISIQFHVLLYYKPVQRVIDCQKELADLIDNTKTTETELSQEGDQFILNKLKEMGYADVDHQKLFEIFYENEQLSDKIYNEMQGDSNKDLKKIVEKKTKLFKELDDFLIEMYQMSPTLIDESKLVNGEEGCLCNIELELIKNNSKEGLFNPKKITEKTKVMIEKQLDQIIEIMQI